MRYELQQFIDDGSCPELVKARVEALRDFLTERNIDADIDDFTSNHIDQQLTLRLTLDFKWRGVDGLTSDGL